MIRNLEVAVGLGWILRNSHCDEPSGRRQRLRTDRGCAGQDAAHHTAGSPCCVKGEEKREYPIRSTQSDVQRPASDQRFAAESHHPAEQPLAGARLIVSARSTPDLQRAPDHLPTVVRRPGPGIASIMAVEDEAGGWFVIARSRIDHSAQGGDVCVEKRCELLCESFRRAVAEPIGAALGAQQFRPVTINLRVPRQGSALHPLVGTFQVELGGRVDRAKAGAEFLSGRTAKHRRGHAQFGGKLVRHRGILTHQRPGTCWTGSWRISSLSVRFPRKFLVRHGALCTECRATSDFRRGANWWRHRNDRKDQ